MYESLNSQEDFATSSFATSSSLEDLRKEVKCVDQLYSYNVITVTIIIQVQEMKIILKEMNERTKKCID